MSDTVAERAGVAEERRALLASILREEGELGPDEEVLEVSQLEGGWSRFSHVARVGLPGGGERRYVVRVKAPFGLFDTDLVVEYNIFAGLEPLDLPTPRAFGLHESPDNPFGGEFFVMEHLPGRSANVWRARDHGSLREDWDGDRGIARDAVQYLARIHSIPVGEAPAGLPEISFSDHVDRWRGAYEEAALNRDPVTEEALDWLDANAPSDARRGLVHGDYRIGNMLMEGGRVTAILDWELAYLGDVRFDLGYISLDYIAGKHLRPKTELLGAIADREWFFSEYERLTGEPLDRDAVRAFAVLGATSLIAMSYTGLSRYAAGRVTDMRRAWARYGLPGLRHELTQLMRW